MWNHAIDLLKAIRYCRADAILAEGKEASSGESLRVFYFGKHRNFHWLMDTLFSDYTAEIVGKKVFTLSFAKWIGEYERKADLSVLDLGHIYSRLVKRLRKDYLCIPDYIGQKRDLSRGKEELLESIGRHRTKKRHVHEIARHNVAYRFATDEKDFLRFYRDFYAPFLKRKFHDHASIDPEEKFLRNCREGIVMEVVQGDRVLACTLMKTAGARLSCIADGYAPDLDRKMHRIACNALYYYSLLLGLEKNCTEVDFAHTRPLLTYGIYGYKRTWDAHVYRFPGRYGEIFLKPTKLTAPVIRIFTDRWFVTLREDRLVAKVLCADGELSVSFLQRFLKEYCSKGIDAYRVYSLREVDPEVVALSREAPFSVEVVDLSRERSPLELFCT